MGGSERPIALGRGAGENFHKRERRKHTVDRCRHERVALFSRLQQGKPNHIADGFGPGQQHCQAAAGYVELGMLLEATAELDNIDLFNRAGPEVLATRLAIYQGLEKWELMQEIAKRLVEFEPDHSQWAISLAFATRRANSIQATKKHVLNAEPKFPREAAIKYNLACYFCQAGDLQKAKDYLKKAFEIDLNLRTAALEDEDLKPLWRSL